MAYNLLVVDDSLVVRKSTKRALDMAEIEVGEVCEASNGKEALKILKEKWIDLVFLDINMPVMNGIEFVREVHRDDLLKSIPIVVISTEGSKERIEELNKLGIKEYLRKPVTPEQITGIVNKLLGG